MRRTVFDLDGVLFPNPEDVMKKVLEEFGSEYRITKDQITHNGYFIPHHILKTTEGLEIQNRFQKVYLAQRVGEEGKERLQEFKKNGSLEILTYNVGDKVFSQMLEESGVRNLFDSFTTCDRNYIGQTKTRFFREIREETPSDVEIVFITDTLSDLKEAQLSGTNPILYFVTEDWNVPKEVLEMVEPKNIIKPFYV